MKFKGTIVITDPCYLMKDNTEDWEKSGYGQDLSVIGLTDYISEETLYGDWSCMTYKGTEEETSNLIIEWDRMYFEFFNTYNFGGLLEEDKTILYKKFEEDKAKFKEVNTLGEFCADAGMVCVAYLDEVLKYNPEFTICLEKDGVVTVINEFDGDIDYIIEGEGNESALHLVGIGNVNFFTSQSGL